MVMQRWEPFNELRRMEETMNRLWRGFTGIGEERDGMESWALPLDVVQEGDRIVVHASVPGVRPDDIDVTFEEGVLTIKGRTQAEHEERQGQYLLRERRTGSFYRAIRLPETVDADKAESNYHNGVLTIAFPKQEAKKAKHLKVNAGASQGGTS
jgi:HSP20 family protein